jgi:hypothetical protein
VVDGVPVEVNMGRRRRHVELLPKPSVGLFSVSDSHKSSSLKFQSCHIMQLSHVS